MDVVKSDCIGEAESKCFDAVYPFSVLDEGPLPRGLVCQGTNNNSQELGGEPDNKHPGTWDHSVDFQNGVLQDQGPQRNNDALSKV